MSSGKLSPSAATPGQSFRRSRQLPSLAEATGQHSAASLRRQDSAARNPLDDRAALPTVAMSPSSASPRITSSSTAPMLPPVSSPRNAVTAAAESPKKANGSIAKIELSTQQPPLLDSPTARSRNSAGDGLHAVGDWDSVRAQISLLSPSPTRTRFETQLESLSLMRDDLPPKLLVQKLQELSQIVLQELSRQQRDRTDDSALQHQDENRALVGFRRSHIALRYVLLIHYVLLLAFCRWSLDRMGPYFLFSIYFGCSFAVVLSALFLTTILLRPSQRRIEPLLVAALALASFLYHLIYTALVASGQLTGNTSAWNSEADRNVPDNTSFGSDPDSLSANPVRYTLYFVEAALLLVEGGLCTVLCAKHRLGLQSLERTATATTSTNELPASIEQ